MPTDTRQKGCVWGWEVFQVILLERNTRTRPLFSPSLCTYTLTCVHTHGLQCVALFTAGGECDHMGRSWCWTELGPEPKLKWHSKRAVDPTVCLHWCQGSVEVYLHVCVCVCVCAYYLVLLSQCVRVYKTECLCVKAWVSTCVYLFNSTNMWDENVSVDMFVRMCFFVAKCVCMT